MLQRLERVASQVRAASWTEDIRRTVESMKRGRRLSNAISTRKSVVTAPRRFSKVQRNEPCPCGSGRKYKDCCFNKGEAFLRKLERQRYKEQQKADGTPWYVRWLT